MAEHSSKRKSPKQSKQSKQARAKAREATRDRIAEASALRKPSRVKYTTVVLFPPEAAISDDEETKQLVTRFQQTQDTTIRDRLLAGHWKLIWQEVSRFIKPINPLFMEAYNEAVIGFSNACTKVDVEKTRTLKTKCITYLIRAASFATIQYLQFSDNTYGVSAGEAKRIRQEWIEELEEVDPKNPMLPTLRKRQTHGKIIYDILHRIHCVEDADCTRIASSSDDCLREPDVELDTDAVLPIPTDSVMLSERREYVKKMVASIRNPRWRNIVELRNGFKPLQNPDGTVIHSPSAQSVADSQGGVSRTAIGKLEAKGLECIRKEAKRLRLKFSDLC